MADAQHRFIVFANAVEGREDEFNEWYDSTHIPEVLDVEGFVACQRFQLTVPSDEAPGKYLAAYEIDGDDPVAAVKRLGAAMPDMTQSEDLDRPSVVALIMTAMGPRHTSG